MIRARILLIVGGGIAAYKSLELIRLMRAGGMAVRVVLTAGGARFVTALSLAALSEGPVYDDLWSLKDEAEMGHIRLSREADLIVICPASASRLARMAAGLGEDLADAVLLATTTPVLAAPAMNQAMWAHPATRRNVAQLRDDGVTILEPDEGAMACGEFGVGRLPEPSRIADAVAAMLGTRGGALSGRHAIVTAGPTHEAVDPVRYLANRSSGRQGFAIAGALAALGARVTLVAGPVALPTPHGVARIDVVSARDMAAAVDRALPADIAVMVAAVADWRVETAGHKLKKGNGPPHLMLVENPDILAAIAAPGPRRPALVIGFAAETERLEERARAKLKRKGADWIVANDVAGDVLGGSDNAVTIVSAAGEEAWPCAPKTAVADRLANRIAEHFAR